MTTIDCREAVSRMWAYLSKDLEGRDTGELEEHLGVCRRCCGELEFNRELRARLAETGTEQIPGDLQARLGAALDEGDHRTRAT